MSGKCYATFDLQHVQQGHGTSFEMLLLHNLSLLFNTKLKGVLNLASHVTIDLSNFFYLPRILRIIRLIFFNVCVMHACPSKDAYFEKSFPNHSICPLIPSSV